MLLQRGLLVVCVVGGYHCIGVAGLPQPSPFQPAPLDPSTGYPSVPVQQPPTLQPPAQQPAAIQPPAPVQQPAAVKAASPVQPPGSVKPSATVQPPSAVQNLSVLPPPSVTPPGVSPPVVGAPPVPEGALPKTSLPTVGQVVSTPGVASPTPPGAPTPGLELGHVNASAPAPGRGSPSPSVSTAGLPVGSTPPIPPTVSPTISLPTSTAGGQSAPVPKKSDSGSTATNPPIGSDLPKPSSGAQSSQAPSSASPPGQVPVPQPPPGAYNAKACNNFVELCNKSWSSVVHLGAHDSPFVRSKENGFSVSGNQYFDVKVQLDAGIRLLQGQIHKEDGKTRLCHSSCKLFDGGLLENYLKKVREWMDQYTSEVVTILLVNNDKIPAKTIKEAFDKADLTRLTYAPPTQPALSPTGWPTLQQLITAQRRIIAFTSTSADIKNVPWLLDEFSYIFETPFEVPDPSRFTCAAHRPGSVSGQEKLQQALQTRIPFMNRFLYANIFDSKVGKFLSGGEAYKPNDTYVATLNGDKPGMPGNLKQGLTHCMTEYKRVGGFVLVDFFNEVGILGESFVVARANGCLGIADKDCRCG